MLSEKVSPSTAVEVSPCRKSITTAPPHHLTTSHPVLVPGLYSRVYSVVAYVCHTGTTTGTGSGSSTIIAAASPINIDSGTFLLQNSAGTPSTVTYEMNAGTATFYRVVAGPFIVDGSSVCTFESGGGASNTFAIGASDGAPQVVIKTGALFASSIINKFAGTLQVQGSNGAIPLIRQSGGSTVVTAGTITTFTCTGGTLSVSAGTVTTINQQLGCGAVTISGGTISVFNTSSTGQVTFSAGSVAQLLVRAPASVTISAGATVTAGAQISGAVGVTGGGFPFGGGIYVMSGGSVSYSGGTLGGTVLMSNTASWTMNSGGTGGSSGAFNVSGGTLYLNGGSIST